MAKQAKKTSKPKQARVVVKNNVRKIPASGDVKWWRVPARCYGVYDKDVSLNFPLFEGKPPRTNIIMMLKKSDMPPELAAIIHNGFEFEVEVPTWALQANEFSFRNFTWREPKPKEALV